MDQSWAVTRLFTGKTLFSGKRMEKKGLKSMKRSGSGISPWEKMQDPINVGGVANMPHLQF